PAGLVPRGHARPRAGRRVVRDPDLGHAEGSGHHGAVLVRALGSRGPARPSDGGGRVTRPTTLAELLERLQRRAAVVGVVGLGHVGESVARLAHAAGFPVLGTETDPARLAALRDALPWLRAGTDPAALGVLCVPTPLAGNGRPALSHVVAAARAVGARIAPGALVVLESTVFPGATREVLLPELLAAARAAGRTLRPGADLFVAHAPE